MNRTGMIVALAAVLLLPVVGFQWGRTSARNDLAVQLAAKTAQSTVLRDSLDVALADVHADTIRVDSIVDRWHKARAVKPDTIVIDTSRVDTLRIPAPATLAEADTVIAALDSSRRQCLSVVSACTRALNAADERARIALVLYETEKAQRSKWRTVERMAWATTLGGVAVWGSRK